MIIILILFAASTQSLLCRRRGIVIISTQMTIIMITIFNIYLSYSNMKSPAEIVDKTDQDDHWYNQDHCHHWHHPNHCLLIEQIFHSSKCFIFENILRSDDIEEVPDLTTARYYIFDQLLNCVFWLIPQHTRPQFLSWWPLPCHAEAGGVRQGGGEPGHPSSCHPWHPWAGLPTISPPSPPAAWRPTDQAKDLCQEACQASCRRAWICLRIWVWNLN